MNTSKLGTGYARSLESIDIAVSLSGVVTAVSGTTVSVSPDGRRAAAGK